MRVPLILTVLAAIGLVACSAPKGYDAAFSDKTAVAGNSHAYAAAPEQVFRSVAAVFVQRGFAIEQTDSTLWMIKATRDLQDPNNKKVSYNVMVTAFVAAAAARGSTVSLSASQQTVLHNKSHNWVPILGPLMIPTSSSYQTVVAKEGGITETNFYSDFFAAVEQNLATTTAVPIATPAPVVMPTAVAAGPANGASAPSP
jgi:hypothetical protein